jgi:hypothetical protein
MWQERFTEMQAKVDKFLRAYKQDFEVDKESILEAPDDTFLWMLRETGTQLVNLTEVKNGKYKITDTALYYFYQQGTPYQMYIVNANGLKRLYKNGIVKYLG